MVVVAASPRCCRTSVMVVQQQEMGFSTILAWGSAAVRGLIQQGTFWMVAAAAVEECLQQQQHHQQQRAVRVSVQGLLLLWVRQQGREATVLASSRGTATAAKALSAAISTAAGSGLSQHQGSGAPLLVAAVE